MATPRKKTTHAPVLFTGFPGFIGARLLPRLLELDPGKRKRFLESLPEASQAFFTFLPGEPWEGYRGPETIVYRVEHGRFED